MGIVLVLPLIRAIAWSFMEMNLVNGATVDPAFGVGYFFEDIAAQPGGLFRKAAVHQQGFNGLKMAVGGVFGLIENRDVFRGDAMF